MVKKVSSFIFDLLYFVAVYLYAYNFKFISFAIFLSILSLILLIKNFISTQYKWFSKIINVIYAIALIYSFEYISDLLVYLLNASGFFFLLHILITLAVFLIFSLKRPFSIKNLGPTLLAQVITLGGFVAYIENSNVLGRCVNSKMNEHIEVLIDYEKLKNNGMLVPWNFEFNEDESKLVVVNRSLFKGSDKSILIYDFKNKKWDFLKIKGKEGSFVTFDPFSKSFLIAAKRNNSFVSISDDDQSSLYWFDESGKILKSKNFPSEISTNTFIFPFEKYIQIYVDEGKYIFNRNNDQFQFQKNSYFEYPWGLKSKSFYLTDAKKLNNGFLLSFGGKFIDSILFSAIIYDDIKNSFRPTGIKMLHGSSQIIHDPIGKLFYSNSLYTGKYFTFNEKFEIKKRKKYLFLSKAMSIDPSKKIGYVANSLKGEIYSIDLESGEKNGGLWSIGSQIRAIKLMKDGSLITGSLCGLYKIRPY